jgi:hypothetical protein
MACFEARIWEKAEHWTFDVSLIAADETAARAQLKRDYPARSYSVRDLRSVWSPTYDPTAQQREIARRSTEGY